MLNNVATLSHMGAWQVGLPALAVTWSQELYMVLEVPPDHSPSLESALASYRPAQRRVLHDALADCAKTGQPFALELQVVTARDRPLWVRVVGQAVRDPAGVITHIQGALQDISASRLAELRQVSVANRRLTTLETISDGVVTLDVHCCFT
jgi:hypothetical protein